MALKPGDEYQVPICDYLHKRMEDVNCSRRQVWREHDKDPREVIATLHEQYFCLFGQRPGIDKI